MTLSEFKSWLDGYLDGKDGLTAEQVAAVQAKLATVQERLDLTPLRPYLEPLTVPGTLPWSTPVMCSGTSAGKPGWLKTATLCNTEH